MLHPVPTIEEAALAVVKGACARRGRRDPTRCKPSEEEVAAAAQAIVDAADAIADPLATAMPAVWDVVVFDGEGLTGAVECPRQGRGGWWRVGIVADEAADAEFSVWLLVRERRVGLGTRAEAPGRSQN